MAHSLQVAEFMGADDGRSGHDIGIANQSKPVDIDHCCVISVYVPEVDLLGQAPGASGIKCNR